MEEETKPDLKKIVSLLKRYYGVPFIPPGKGPFELILWENACYLLPDDRRLAVFEGLKKQVGLTPDTILKANPDVLLALATMGGMRPKVRVFRWQEIARIAKQQFAGNLDQVLSMTYGQAKKALKQFPNIGDPGAEKILMFCGVAPGLPLEWNGLRVLTRIGYGREHVRNYGKTYKSVQEDIQDELPRRPEAVASIHLLLRQHGKELCRNNTPQCYECPVSSMCAYPAKRMKSFLRS